MPTVAMYLLACALPAAAFAVAERAWMSGARPPAPGRSTSAAAFPTPVGRPIERLTADLTRLSDELTALRSSALYAKRHKMEAVSLAYDDTLLDCCRALEVPVPAVRRLDSAQRLQVEAELARAGLVW